MLTPSRPTRSRLLPRLSLFVPQGHARSCAGRGTFALSLAAAGLSRRAMVPHRHLLPRSPSCGGEETAALLNRESLPVLGSTPDKRGRPTAAAPSMRGEGSRRVRSLVSLSRGYFWRTDATSERPPHSLLHLPGRPFRGPPRSRDLGRGEGAGQAAGSGSRGRRGSRTFPWPRPRGPAVGGS